MSIDCSSNSKLDALNAKKAELESQVANLASAGSSAMAAVKEKANSMVSALQDMMPTIPEIPNFQKELQELAGKVGNELIEAKAAFKARWGDSLPDVDIDDLMNKVTLPSMNLDFDLCKDVPNVDAPEIVNGKVTKVKDKGPEPTTPNSPPVVVEAVTPTIVAKEQQPSASGRTTRGIIEITKEYDEYRKEVRELQSLYFTAEMKAYAKNLKKAKKKRDFKKLQIRKEKLGFKNNGEFYNSGEATEKEKKLLEETYAGWADAQKGLKQSKLIKRLSAWYDQFRYSDTFEGYTVISHFARYKKEFFTYLITDFSNGKYTVTDGTLSIEPLNNAILPIVEKYDKLLKERNTYLHGDRE